MVASTEDDDRRDTIIFRNTVGKWRSRFQEERLDGLLDEPRPGAPGKIGDNEIERLIALTLETEGRYALEHAHHGEGDWLQSKRGQSDLASILTAVSSAGDVQDFEGPTLRREGSRHRRAQKSQIQALDRTQPLLPMMPGR